MCLIFDFIDAYSYYPYSILNLLLLINLSDTCVDSKHHSPAGSGCSQPLWMQVYDTKVFLANVGLQSWGNREELYRFEVFSLSFSFPCYSLFLYHFPFLHHFHLGIFVLFFSLFF